MYFNSWEKERITNFYQSVLYLNKTISSKDVLKYNNDYHKQQIIDLYESRIKEHEKLNKSINEINLYNTLIEQSFIEDMLANGVKESKIFKMKGKGFGPKRRNGYYAHWNKVIEDLKSYVPRNYITIKRSNKVMIDMGEFTAHIDLDYKLSPNEMIEKFFKDAIEQIKFVEDANKNKDEVFKKYIDYAKINHIEIPDFLISVKQIIEYIEEIAKEKYIDSIQGEEIDVAHGDGDSCVLEIGEHRCQCGNNRYYIEVDGSAITEYYAYGQWH